MNRRVHFQLGIKLAIGVLCGLLMTASAMAQGKQDNDRQKNSGSNQNQEEKKNKGNDRDGDKDDGKTKKGAGDDDSRQDRKKRNDQTGAEPKSSGLATAQANVASELLKLPARKMEYAVAKLPGIGFKYEATKARNGHVTVKFAKSESDRDEVKKKITPMSAPMCLTKEEVSGQKIENEITIADGSMALQILPGGVVDADELLKSGNFVYQRMDQRKSYSVSTTSSLAIRREAMVRADRNGGFKESAARSAILALTAPTNFRGMPNVRSDSSLEVSTFAESMGIDVGGSFFYMGVSADSSFGFTSEKYHYMYLFQFDQTFLSIIADGIRSSADLFEGDVSEKDNWMYVREVKYGRRLYVMLESEYDLAKVSTELNGNVSWGAVAAALSSSSKNSQLQRSTQLRVVTQGGKALGVSDPSQIQRQLDDYFESRYRENDIVPLAYKLTYLDGSPASLITEAFLDGNSCLKSNRFRVYLKQVGVEESKKNKEVDLYGGASIRLFDTANRQVQADGRTPVPDPGVEAPAPAGKLTFATKETPESIGPHQPKVYSDRDQGYYFDFITDTLDLEIQVAPYMYERDSFADDAFTTNDRMKKSLRELLTQGPTRFEFDMQTKQTKTRMIVELIPQ